MSKIEEALKQLEKTYGKGVVIYGDKSLGVPKRSSGILSFDLALGGGFGKGRIIEVFGPESCLAGDTFIPYSLRKEGGKLRNSKGGSLKTLFEKFNKKPLSQKYLKVKQPLEGDYYTVPCINELNRIEHARVKDVVFNGVKPVYSVLLSNGMQIKATSDHKFYTGTKYVTLESLSVGDIIHVHNNTTFKVDSYQYKYYKEVFVKYHPSWKKRIINGCTYYRSHVSRAVFEANMNGYAYDEFVALLNKGYSEETANLLTIPENHHIHHIDEDITNNSLDNLCMISSSDHDKIHASERHNNLRFISVPEQIISIEYAGEEEVFDIKCEDPYHNYVANGFVVHNCGKTTLSIHAMAQAQRDEPDKHVVIIDAEHALDTEYCRALGLDLSKAIICQPNNGEEGLQVAIDLIATGEVSFALIDSIPALVPTSTIQGEMEDVQMAVHARMISRFLQKITATASKTDTTVYMVNQIRNKIGVMYGSPETTPGGLAPRYYASQRVQIRAGKDEKEGTEVKNKVVNYTVIKNKIAAPFKKGTLFINFGTGVDKVRDLWDAALRLGVITVTGRTYKVLGVQLSSKSRDDAYETFSGTVEIHEQVYKTCIDLLKDGGGDTQEHSEDNSDDDQGSF